MEKVPVLVLGAQRCLLGWKNVIQADERMRMGMDVSVRKKKINLPTVATSKM